MCGWVYPLDSMVYWGYYEGGGGPGAKPPDDAFYFFSLLIFGYNDVATLRIRER